MQNVRAVSTMDHISLQSPFLIELWELLTPPPPTHTHTLFKMMFWQFIMQLIEQTKSSCGDNETKEKTYLKKY